jgi:ATP-dependent Clp protease adaptor protein ClpS
VCPPAERADRPFTRQKFDAYIDLPMPACHTDLFHGFPITSGHEPDQEGELQPVVRDEVTEPPMFRVLLLNDDYTTMDFVVEILRLVFNKSIEEATRIMLNVHNDGVGLCGVYTYEVAETKVETVHSLAREHGFPLKCTMEND